MKYDLRVIDNPKWIESIAEVSNQKDIIVLEVDLRPKYLDFVEGGSSNPREYTFDIFATDETIYFDKNNIGPCEIKIIGESQCHVLTKRHKYGLTITLMNIDSDIKVVYSGKINEEV